MRRIVAHLPGYPLLSPIKVDATNQGKENSCFYNTSPSFFERKAFMIDK